MSDLSRERTVRVGAEVAYIDVAPHPTRPTVYGRVREVCTTCGEAVIDWRGGEQGDRVPLDRIGKARPQASVRLVGATDA